MMEELYRDNEWRIVRESARLPHGGETCASRVERADTVSILAFTEFGEVLLLREFRPFYGDYIWMIPSGRVDKETDSYEAACRELREETGYRAQEMTHYSTTNPSESLKFSCFVYVACGLVRDPLPQDADELIAVHALPLEEAIDNVLSSGSLHTVSAYALLRYAREHGR